MTRTIIVPIDMSHTEKAAAMIDTARQLAGDDGSVVLLNIVEELPAHVSTEFPGRYIEDAQRTARKTLAKIAKGSGLNATVEVRVGHAHTGILAMADEKKADVVVVGSHKPGFSDYFIGSTAARVVRHAKCSVMVLR